MSIEAASFTVNGIHGALLLFAVLLFLGAAFAAWFAPAWPRALFLVSAGLCLATLALLVSG